MKIISSFNHPHQSVVLSDDEQFMCEGYLVSMESMQAFFEGYLKTALTAKHIEFFRKEYNIILVPRPYECSIDMPWGISDKDM